MVDRKPSKGFVRYLPTILGLLVAVGMVLFMINSGIFNDIDFRDLHWGYVVLLLMARFVTWGCMGLSLAVFLRHADIELDFVEWYGLIVSSLLMNKVTPIAGAALVRAGYLKIQHSFPISQFSALMAANILINYFVGGLSGLIVICVLSLSSAYRSGWEAIPVMAGAIAMPVVALVLPWHRLSLAPKSRMMRWANLALEGWNKIRSARQLLLTQVVLVLLIIASQATAYIVAPLTLGKSTNVLNMIFISILTNITRVTPIRDLFGLTELVAGLGTQIAGGGIELGVTAALMIRLSGIVGNLLLGPIFIYLLSRRLGAPLMQQIKQVRTQIE